MIICDGCNVRGTWEHRCYGERSVVLGEQTNEPCECLECRELDRLFPETAIIKPKKNTAQKVWYYDHIVQDIKEGLLYSKKDLSGYDEHPTFAVKTKHGETCRIPQDRVFNTKNQADIFLKEMIRQIISEKKLEIKQLQKRL